MTATLALLIIGLALVDSTSLGMSLIPLWLLLSPGRLSKARISSYLVTLTLAYLAMGVAVAAGAAYLVDGLRDWILSVPDAILTGAQAVVGGLIVAFGLTLLVGRVRDPEGRAAASLLRWRNEAMTVGSSRGLVRLAMVAFAVEFATMIPYVGAIAAMIDAGMSWPSILLWIVIYCIIMMAPATILTVLRLSFGDRIDPFLRRLDSWFERNMGAVSGSGLILLGGLVTLAAFAPSFR